MPWSVFVVCKTYKTNWQTESNRVKIRCGTPFDGPFGTKNYVEWNLYEKEVYEDASTNSHQIRAEILEEVGPVT